MITYKNSQRTVPVDRAHVITIAQQILDILKYSDFDLSILITTEQTIRRYNREFRQIDKPTDILSFPFHPELQAGKRIRAHTPDDKNLGDLIIAASYVQRDAVRYNMTFDERLIVLLVHGMCHLLGYDHITDADYRRMRTKEQHVLKKLYAHHADDRCCNDQECSSIE